MIESLFRSQESVHSAISQEEFERLMLDSYRKVFAYASRLAGNPSDAEDLCQEAYLRAFRFFHRFDQSQPFTSWMYRIVTNVHIDGVRKSSKYRMVSLDNPANPNASWDLPDNRLDPEQALVSEQMDSALQNGLNSMNPEFRTAVVLADLEGMAYEEIAETMKTSVGTVRSRIHRGRKHLRSFLTRNYPGRFCAKGETR